MKLRMVAVVMAFCFGCLFASEMVIKNSVPFSFPLAVGIRGGAASKATRASFIATSNYLGKKSIELSWSLSGKVENGNIAIYSMTGVRIKTFSVADRQGSVEWNISTGTKVASGIYFARLSNGDYKKNIKLFVY